MAGGKNPVTRGNLTARRHGRSERQHPVAFISLDFAVPKSVSLLSEIGGDKRIRGAVRAANDEVVALFERDYAGVRPRKKSDPDRNGFRKTGKIAAVSYLENDSREGDPHLHVHNAIFNVTLDERDPGRRLKALGMTKAFKDQRLLSDFATRQLQAKVRALGYMTVPTLGGRSFEIAGVGRQLIRKVSKRHETIKAGVASRKRRNRAAGLEEDERELELKVAKKTRPKKKIRLQSDLRAQWERELTHEERQLLVTLAANAQGLQAPDLGPSPQEAASEPVPAMAPRPVSRPARERDPAPTLRSPAVPVARPLVHPPRPAPVALPAKPGRPELPPPPPPPPPPPDEVEGMTL